MMAAERLRVSWGGIESELAVCLTPADAAAVRARWPHGVVVIEEMFAREDGRSLRAKCFLANMVARERGVASRFSPSTPVSELVALARGGA